MTAPDSTAVPVLAEGYSYPVYLDLRGRRVLVVGAGAVAARKIERLVAAGAHVTVVAPTAIPAVAERDDVRWHRRPYQQGEVKGYRLALTCTGVPEVDSQVFADGEASGVWVNSADDVDNCSFILPAVARRGPLSISVSTQGVSPALASWLRRRMQLELDDGVEELARLLSAVRAELRATAGTTEHPGWNEALDDGLLETIRAGDSARAQQRLRASLGLGSAPIAAGRAADTTAAGAGHDPASETADSTAATDISASSEARQAQTTVLR